jgi:hypothetical protein
MQAWIGSLILQVGNGSKPMWIALLTPIAFSVAQLHNRDDIKI